MGGGGRVGEGGGVSAHFLRFSETATERRVKDRWVEGICVTNIISV